MIQLTFLSIVYHLSIDGVMAQIHKSAKKKHDNGNDQIYLSICRCEALLRVIMVALMKEKKKHENGNDPNILVYLPV